MNMKSTRIFHLHLELEMEHMQASEIQALKKWGKVSESISRDILVRSDMPLHNLHFVIQKAFGWLHCHLHRFTLPEELYTQITGDRFKKWVKLCGVYFRWPTENYDALYWDEYDEKSDFEKWLRTRYAPPYINRCYPELYFDAHEKATKFATENPMLRISRSFEEFRQGKRDPVIKPIEDVTMKEASRMLECGDRELLERITLSELLHLKPDADQMEQIEHAYKNCEDAWMKLRPSITELEALNAELTKSRRGRPSAKLMQKQERYNELFREIVRETQLPVPPLTDMLFYAYDYGDDWNITIKLSDVYDSPDTVPEEIADLYTQACKKGAACIAADGLSVFDDVGGIHGYCEFLHNIHGVEYDPEEIENMRAWARDKGWTGRLSMPKNIL